MLSWSLCRRLFPFVWPLSMLRVRLINPRQRSVTSILSPPVFIKRPYLQSEEDAEQMGGLYTVTILNSIEARSTYSQLGILDTAPRLMKTLSIGFFFFLYTPEVPRKERRKLLIAFLLLKGLFQEAEASRGRPLT